MSNYEQLMELFKEHLEIPDDFTKCPWYGDLDETIYWNTEGNEYDLVACNGETYSAEIKYAPIQIDDYILLTLRSDFGGYYQAFFKKSNEIDVSEYE